MPPFLMFWSIVLTANHYFLDAVAGGAVVLFGYRLAIGLAGCRMVLAPGWLSEHRLMVEPELQPAHQRENARLYITLRERNRDQNGETRLSD